jgi:hypothetical protein
VARYVRNYIGERRTCSVGIKLTPTERLEFEAAANALGMTLSVYLRDLCAKRSANVASVIRRSPEAKAIMRELSAIGNNINQLAKHANTVDEMPSRAVLLTAIDRLKEAMAHILEL